jgi:hypothetical protein
MGLSKSQSKKLGVLLAVISNESMPPELLEQAISDGLTAFKDGKYLLTSSGIDEKNRLCTLAGLNIRLSSEKKPRSCRG